METVKDRLKKVMDELGLKPLTPASTCEGITKNMMYKLWQSKTGTVSSNILEPFCKQYTEVDCNYLLRGYGDMFISCEKETLEIESKTSDIDIAFMRGQIKAYQDALDRIGHANNI